MLPLGKENLELRMFSLSWWKLGILHHNLKLMNAGGKQAPNSWQHKVSQDWRFCKQAAHTQTPLQRVGLVLVTATSRAGRQGDKGRQQLFSRCSSEMDCASKVSQIRPYSCPPWTQALEGSCHATTILYGGEIMRFHHQARGYLLDFVLDIQNRLRYVKECLSSLLSLK